MNKFKFTKGLVCMLVCVMLIESVAFNIRREVRSDENGISKKDAAITWLKNNQNDDGSWGEELKLYETCEVLKYTGKNDFINLNVREQALDWLTNQKTSNNDDLFHLYSIEEIEFNKDISEVLELQNDDGGFSLNKVYKSDVLDTLLAMEAITDASVINSSSMRKVAKYIISCQNDDGSFSYTDNGESNTYITAYSCYVLNKYININKTSQEAEIAFNSCKKYLVTGENDADMWGTGRDELKASLMASLALAQEDKDKTLIRINKFADIMEDNGSLYNDAVLTAMFVKLVNTALNMGEDTDKNAVSVSNLYVHTTDGQEISAFTDVYVEPIVEGFDEKIMTLSVVAGTKEAGYEQAEKNENNYILNTGYKTPGKYDIYAIITDKDTGNTLSIKKKVIEIEESFDVTESYFEIAPKYYRVVSGKEISFELSADVKSNIRKTIDVEVNVKDDEGNNIYTGSSSKECGADITYIEFNDFKFLPQMEENQILYAQAVIKSEGKILKTIRKNISVYANDDGKALELDYSLSKPYLLPEEDKVSVGFEISGVGTTEDIKRNPIDMVICLDNSGSMSSKDWKQARAAAEKIVEFLQEYDRCAIQYVNYSKPICQLTSDKETIIKAINKSRYAYGKTPVDTSINNAIDILKDSEEGRDKIYLLLSDGEPTDYTKAVTSAQNAVDVGINIYTLGLRESGEEFLQTIAALGNGAYLYSPTNEELVKLMTQIAGNIFNIAGSNVKLSMTLESDIAYENIVISPEPDNLTKNEDGTTTIIFTKPYISLGEKFDYDINFKSPGFEYGEMVKLIKDIKLEYNNENDENVEIVVDDVNIRVAAYYIIGQVSTDKENYSENENVIINLNAKKESSDKTLTGSIQIVDKNGNLVEKIEDEIIIEDELESTFNWNTKDIMPGEYTVNVSWNKNDSIVGTQKCTINITEEKEPEKEEETVSKTEEDFVKIKGDINVEKKELLIGDSVKVNFSAKNLGTKDLNDTEMTLNIVNASTEENTVIYSKRHNVIQSETLAEYIDYDSSKMDSGEYIVTYMAKSGEEQIFLGASGFTLKEPKYSVKVEAGKGGKIVEDVSGNYVKGSELRLKAEAFSGYEFKGFTLTGEGKIENAYSSDTVFYVADGDAVINAVFESKDNKNVANDIEIKEENDKKSLSEKTGDKETESQKNQENRTIEETGNVKAEIVNTGDLAERQYLMKIFRMQIVLLVITIILIILRKKSI